MFYRGDEQALRNTVDSRCEILEGAQAQAILRFAQTAHRTRRGRCQVIAAMNDAIRTALVQGDHSSMNDIFIAVNGNLLKRYDHVKEVGIILGANSWQQNAIRKILRHHHAAHTRC